MPVASLKLAHHADRGQRIAAQIEEAIVDAHFFQLQQIAPETRQLLLHFGPGSDEVLGEIRPFAFRPGQGLAVEFAIWRQWKLLEMHESRGNHVVRQRPLEGLNQRCHAQALGACVVCGEPFFAGTILAQDDRGLSDPIDLGHRAFDLAQLNAKPAQFDLEIGAAEKLDVSVGQEARQVTGPVDAPG